MPSLLTDDGATVSYTTAGSGSQTLLFVHGWGHSGRFWNEFVPLLDLRRYRAVCLDLRGHGASGPAREDCFTVARMARDVLAVADAVGAQEFVLVGHSLGAKIAQFLTASEPQRVRGQVLIGCVGPGKVPIPPELIAQVCDAAEAGADRVFEMLAPFVVVRPIPDLAWAWAESIASTPRAVLEATNAMVVDSDLTALVQTTRRPTLVIAGDREPIYTVDYQRANILAAIPHAELVVLECAHGIVIERPAEVATHLCQFPGSDRRRSGS